MSVTPTCAYAQPQSQPQPDTALSHAASPVRYSKTQLLADIAFLQQQERLALLDLREQADVFINQAEQIMHQARAVPAPDTLLSTNQYICTESWSVASKALDVGRAVVEYARQIKEHCIDLQHEPYPDHQLDNLATPAPPDGTPAEEPDFVAMELEAKARKNEIAAKLKKLYAYSSMAATALRIERQQGLTAAADYLRRMEDEQNLGLDTVKAQQSTHSNPDSDQKAATSPPPPPPPSTSSPRPAREKAMATKD